MAAWVRFSVVLLTTLLFAACSDGNGNRGPAPVPPPELQEIRVDPVEAEVIAGFTQQYTATGIFSDGSEQDLDNSVIWSSSAEDIAVIDSAGLATLIVMDQAKLPGKLCAS